MGTLYIPIGVLGSGKSTWAEKMAAENSDVKIVCPDAIRAMLNGTYLYIEGLDIAITEICKEAIRQLVKENLRIIVDCCNLVRKRRDGWIEASFVGAVAKEPKHKVPIKALKKAYRIVAVIFPNKDKSWHVDNVMKSSKCMDRGRAYWEKVYDLHISQFEPVDEKMFDEILYVEER